MLRYPYIVAALIASLALFGCSGASKPAQAPESNPWADYKGTYAAGGAGDAPTAAPVKAESKPTPEAPESKATAPEPKPKKGEKPKKVAKGEPKSEPKAEMKPDAATDAKAMYGLPSTEAKADDAAPGPAPKKTTKKHAAGVAKPKTKKPATAKR